MEDNYELAFNLILHAGNAKSSAMLAIKEAREFNFEAAAERLKQAEEESTLAHQTQTDMIQAEANGRKMNVDLIMVHAQDHLNGAMLVLDQARELINVYRLLSKLLNKEDLL